MNEKALVSIVVVVAFIGAFVGSILSDLLVVQEDSMSPSLSSNVKVVSYGWDQWSGPLTGYIKIGGPVWNYGSIGCFANLSYSLNDTRGWRLTGYMDLGWIPSDGGSIDVDRTFEWPSVYGGKLLNQSGAPTLVCQLAAMTV